MGGERRKEEGEHDWGSERRGEERRVKHEKHPLKKGREKKGVRETPRVRDVQCKGNARVQFEALFE
jgi:hypothetical protein